MALELKLSTLGTTIEKRICLQKNEFYTKIINSAEILKEGA
jgi:hypothetical protein